jgi:hypothetical protein
MENYQYGLSNINADFANQYYIDSQNCRRNSAGLPITSSGYAINC